MLNLRPSSLLFWLMPFLAVFLAVVARSLLDPWLGEQIPFGFFILAVVLTALKGGFGPALLAGVLSTFAADYFFLEPRYTLLIFHGTQATVALAVFFGISVVIAFLGYRLQLSRGKLGTSYEALKKSERRYRVVADNTDAWEFWMDPKGTFLYNSPSCEQVTGYRPEEFAADPELFDRIICEEDKHCFAEHHGGEAGGECATEEAQFRVVRKDGGVRWIHHLCHPIYDSDGTYLGIRGSNRDITERKNAAEELRAAQISAELARSAAERANQAKDEFLAVLSHELRTPLAPVLAAVQLMQRMPEGKDVMRGPLEIVRRNVQLEARLIDDLLDLSRIASGKIVLEHKPLYISSVIERTIEICKPDVEARRLHFDVDIQARRSMVSGDASRLQQVFWNLLKNSIKFTPDGGHVSVRCHDEDENVIIEVADTGIGIEPEAISRIFNAFEQGDKLTTRQFGGLGLGLAITKRLVEMHEGNVSAHSAGKGQGATFRVILPTVTAQAEAEAEERDAVPPSLSRRVLLVEDHGDSAATMQALLASSGYEVETAGDVAQARAAISKKHFDLLISDLGLPDGSGLELMQEIRRDDGMLKGIALSGYGREEDLKRSREVGYSAHLTKPVDFDALVKTVERVLEGKREQFSLGR